MSETGTEGAKKGGAIRLALGGLAVLGVVAVLYVTLSATLKPQGGAADLKALKTGAMADLMVPDAPGKPMPTAAFTDGTGKTVHLSDFKGKVIVLNFWATWCPPCVKELPTLAQLSKSFDGAPVVVLTVSVDKEEASNLVVSKIAALPPLKGYQDPHYELLKQIDPFPPGFPATIIYDKTGVERARMQKDADWSSPDTRKVIAALANEP